jgi:GDP-L-fucose synthase
MRTPQKIYVAGHRGKASSAIFRYLQKNVIANEARRSVPHVITCIRSELDQTNKAAVQAFFAAVKSDQVYLAAAKVGCESSSKKTS